MIQLYGLTETSPLVTASIPGSKSYSSSGYAVSNTELKIVDSDMKALGPNEVSGTRMERLRISNIVT